MSGKPLPDSSVRSFHDLVYREVDGHKLHLNLHLPADAGKKVPLVFYVHGGAWHSGWRYDATNLDSFIRAGYAMSAMDYRYSQDAKFPAQIEDVKCALQWLRIHADDYGLDAENIVAWGHSAGGHLVSLLGLTAESGLFESEEYAGISTAVRAVGNIAGPSDLMGFENHPSLKHVEALLGGKLEEKRELARLASPICHIGGQIPPFLMVHGDQDASIPLEQSINFHRALRNAGADSRLLIQKGVEHSNLDHPEMVKELVEFFDSVLNR